MLNKIMIQIKKIWKKIFSKNEILFPNGCNVDIIHNKCGKTVEKCKCKNTPVKLIKKK